jgi:spermidine/putrescine transport system permease protein
VRFSFNEGRSRSSTQGWSDRWYWGDPDLSVWHDPDLKNALFQSLQLAGIAILVTVPLGVALAIGLTRWRGRTATASRFTSMVPLVTPEIVMGVSLLLLFLQVFPTLGLGTTAQAIGQVTFTISYVVVIVRGRLVSIGPEYEEAAADLGAPPRDQLFRVLLPLLAPAILASAGIVFALSIDDFVVTQYLAGGSDTNTVSMLLYATARGAPTPALNALATITLVLTLVTLALAYLVYRRFAGAGSATEAATLGEM